MHCFYHGKLQYCGYYPGTSRIWYPTLVGIVVILIIILFLLDCSWFFVNGGLVSCTSGEKLISIMIKKKRALMTLLKEVVYPSYRIVFFLSYLFYSFLSLYFREQSFCLRCLQSVCIINKSTLFPCVYICVCMLGRRVYVSKSTVAREKWFD